MANYCISVDWLQVFCHKTIVIELGNYVGKSLRTYVVEDTGNSTQVFASVYKIMCKGFEVAVLCMHPKSSVINPFACTLKIDNRLLYHQGYIDYLYDIMYALRLDYKGITRLDLCYDCNTLEGGESVSKLLYDCVFSPCNQEGHTYRRGSRKMTINCNRNQSSGAEITALRWGSRSSAVCVYAYNKSLEMLECKIKPWIVECWEKNGLVHKVYDRWDKLSEKQQKSKIDSGQTTSYLESSVWRFEISIKAEGRDILNIEEGDLFCLSPRFIECQSKIESLFWAYAEKYLCFYRSQGQKNPRDYPRYFPLSRRNDDVVTDMPISINQFADTGKTEIAAANLLEKLSTEYSDLGEQYSFAMVQCIEFLKRVSGFKKMESRIDDSSEVLSRMVAEKRLSLFDGMYINYLDKVYEERRGAHPELMYNFTRSLIDAVREADEREWAAAQEQ